MSTPKDFQIGQRITTTHYGIERTGTVTRLGKSLVFVLLDGSRGELFRSPDDLRPIPSEIIKLRNIQGIARKSGTDEHGNAWIQFEVDYLAEQEAGECSICSKMLEYGWLCLDGGEEVCNSHVQIEE